MKLRHAVLPLMALSAAGFGALFLLGAEGKLPPALASAVATVESLASSTATMSASRTVLERADAGDAGTAAPRKTMQTAPLSSAQLGAPLVHGKFVSDCGAPDDMNVVVQVSVRMGRAIAVAATTHPTNAAVASCVEKATREMQWDASPKTQRLTVSY